MKLSTFNALSDKAMSVITPIGVVVGLALGSRIAAYKGWGTFFFACITFIGALQISFSQVLKALKRGRAIGMVLVCAHVLIPLMVKALASLAFPASPSYVTGFVLLSSIPIAVTSFLWTTIHRGDGALALALILLDTLLSPLLTPLTVRLLADSAVKLDFQGMIVSLLYMIVIPSLLGMLVKQAASEACTKARPYLSPVTKVCMMLVIVLHVASLSGTLTFSAVYLRLILMNLVVIALGFVLIYSLGRYVLHEDRASVVSMTFTGGMRNISAALVLATTYFDPGTALPVVIGILLQQTFVGLLGARLFRRDTW
jgi:BASS family bile acid:Na+ symporter